MQDINEASLTNAIEEIRLNGAARIDKDVIYPELRRILFRAAAWIIGVVILDFALSIYITSPILWVFFHVHGLSDWDDVIFSDFNIFGVGAMGFTMVVIFRFIFDYLLFKHGVAPRIKIGSDLLIFFEEIGKKIFKWYLIVLLFTGLFHPYIGMFINFFLFGICINIYIEMEMKRLGLPKSIDMLNSIFKTFNKN